MQSFRVSEPFMYEQLMLEYWYKDWKNMIAKTWEDYKIFLPIYKFGLLQILCTCYKQIWNFWIKIKMLNWYLLKFQINYKAWFG